MTDMDDERGAAVDDIEAVELNGPTKTEKPRGKCTGCAFEYQLTTIRSGELKGTQVIRKHNSRTGPGLCSGAYDVPEGSVKEHTTGCTEEQRFGPSVCDGCCNDPDQVPQLADDVEWTHVQSAEFPDVVGVAPGGTPIVAAPTDLVGAITVDPFTAPGPVNPRPKSVDSVLGPWTTASFDGPCDGSSCRSRIVEGEEMRADGSGGWLCEPCGEDAEIVKTTVPDPWTPTGTVLDRMTPEQRAEALSTSNTVTGIHAGTAPDPSCTCGRTQGTHLCTCPVYIADMSRQTTALIEVLDKRAPEQKLETAARMDAVASSVLGLPRDPRFTAPDPWSAPAPASDIPESTTTVSGQPEPDRDRWGRYLIMGTAHTRATTFAKLGANTKAIEAWNERNVIRGLTLRPDLLMLANGLEVKRDREQLNSIASQAKDAAGSKVAANIGTAYHAFSERIDAGLMTLADVPEQYRGRVQQYITRVANAGLTTRPEWIERTTAVRADQIGAPLPVAGTLDRIFQLPDGSLVIGDLKTGSDLSYGEMEIEVQLALYAHGVNTHGLFDWNTKTWGPVRWDAPWHADTPQVRTDIAIVVHLPADGDGCTLYVADIERGWRDAQRLGPLQASLKEKKRFRTLTAADLEPVAAPEPTAEQYIAATAHHPAKEAPIVSAPLPETDPWGYAVDAFRTATDKDHLAKLYEVAVGLGFHVDQLAVLVGLGKDRLNALARA